MQTTLLHVISPIPPFWHVWTTLNPQEWLYGAISSSPEAQQAKVLPACCFLAPPASIPAGNNPPPRAHPVGWTYLGGFQSTSASTGTLAAPQTAPNQEFSFKSILKPGACGLRVPARPEPRGLSWARMRACTCQPAHESSLTSLSTLLFTVHIAALSKSRCSPCGALLIGHMIL